MKKLARNTLALGTATMIVTAGLSFAANGADATTSYSSGRFLTGSIGGTNLDTLAQVRGVTAANPGNAGPNRNPLDLTVLSALPINIPGGLDLSDLLRASASGSAGAINQFAAAPTTSRATGASGLVDDSGALVTPNSTTPPADAEVGLGDGTQAEINDGLGDVDLLVGALSSSTTVAAGSPARDYRIAGLNLRVDVPLLGELVGDLTTAGAPLDGPDVDDITVSPAVICPAVDTVVTVGVPELLAQLDTLQLGAVSDLVEPILTQLGLTQVDLCDVNPLLQVVGGLTDDVIGDLITVNVTGVGDVLSGVADLSDDGISIDLTGNDAGTITIDLATVLTAAGVNLNQLPPNTDILSYLTDDLVSGKIATLLDSVVTDVVENIGDVNISATVAGTTVPLELADLTDPISTNLVDVLGEVTDAVTPLGTAIDPVLADLVPDLRQLVALTGNNQSTSKTPTLGTGTVNAGNVSAAAVSDYYRTSALRIDLPDGTLNLDLAASEAATLAAAPAGDGAAAGDGSDNDSDNDADSGGGSDADSGSGSDRGAGGGAGGGGSDSVADSDAQADADVTTTLPSTGASNLLPFWLLGIALLMFGGAVLVNEKRRLNATI